MRPGGTIVEPTSANTGVSFAIVAAQQGTGASSWQPTWSPTRRSACLEAYGAEVVVCPVAVKPDDSESYSSVAERLVREIPGARVCGRTLPELDAGRI